MTYADPGEVIGILGSLTIIGAVLFPIARALGRRIEGKPQVAQVPAETNARLDRIEHAVEAIAVEVERISEGQRFTTKLLAERTAADASSRSLERGGR
ncbi:MAG: hypothetical protein ACJ79K_00850 [Gemmatimonadaceae bacterium]